MFVMCLVAGRLEGSVFCRIELLAASKQRKLHISYELCINNPNIVALLLTEQAKLLRIPRCLRELLSKVTVPFV
jgi:hypothetical protein